MGKSKFDKLLFYGWRHIYFTPHEVRLKRESFCLLLTTKSSKFSAFQTVVEVHLTNPYGVSVMILVNQHPQQRFFFTFFPHFSLQRIFADKISVNPAKTILKEGTSKY